MVNNISAQCGLLLAAGLQSSVLLPGSDAYIERQASYWAANASLRPSCIVQPHITEEVFRVLKVLAETDGLVAVRSGGHTQWAGSNDIHEGVTIDLGRMTNVTYDAHSKLASIQPGGRWVDVYQELLKYQVCVTGGRDGNVGVGGFLTGGGNSYYAGLHGLGCDNVANFEVVLADGDIINASAVSHSDLWTALKGGSGNFGIVTRFDMYTFPAQDLWGGVRAAIRSEGDGLAQTMVDFTDQNHKNPQAAYIVNYAFDLTSSSDVLVAHVIAETSGTFNASVFEKIMEIPVVVEDVKQRSMADMARTYTLPSHQEQVWFSLTFKNDVRIIKTASKLHDALVEDLKSLIPANNFSTQCLFQPMPTLFAEQSVRRGGNVLGLDQVKENTLLWLLVGSTETPEESSIMREKLTAFSAALESFAESEGLNIDWRYLNYVDETQNPLQSYGKGNVDFMRKVAARYDPSGVFQSKVVSGWKISKIDA
ncbi:FAD-binding domain-containing protein [Lizonia empirigonia]|nr:FAD-binding domain-containing protein [Lizonia empirigonia]